MSKPVRYCFASDPQLSTGLARPKMKILKKLPTSILSSSRIHFNFFNWMWDMTATGFSLFPRNDPYIVYVYHRMTYVKLKCYVSRILFIYAKLNLAVSKIVLRYTSNIIFMKIEGYNHWFFFNFTFFIVTCLTLLFIRTSKNLSHRMKERNWFKKW